MQALIYTWIAWQTRSDNDYDDEILQRPPETLHLRQQTPRFDNLLKTHSRTELHLALLAATVFAAGNCSWSAPKLARYRTHPVTLWRIPDSEWWRGDTALHICSAGVGSPTVRGFFLYGACRDLLITLTNWGGGARVLYTQEYGHGTSLTEHAHLQVNFKPWTRLVYEYKNVITSNRHTAAVNWLVFCPLVPSLCWIWHSLKTHHSGHHSLSMPVGTQTERRGKMDI